MALCAPLSAEDAQAQSMPDASPAKWHLAHTTWFFETFVLAPGMPSYQCFDSHFQVLFNSYYNSVGPQHPRPKRGLLSRPTLEQVIEYRHAVDSAMAQLADAGDEPWQRLAAAIEIGINHEQQHQELLLTDIKHLFFCSSLYPVYRADLDQTPTPAQDLEWSEQVGGLCSIGANPARFYFDNEGPQHQVYVQPFAIANRPVSNAEYLSFMRDGGYENAALWLSDGWDKVKTERWNSPLYWEQKDGEWQQFTLSGLRSIDPQAPVTHVSYYEADAYASWTGARLPREAEWEVVAATLPVCGNFVECNRLHPGGVRADTKSVGPARMFGDVWEWTSSPYVAYPGYHAVEGALGEYNGKFMCNQLVLRGGSCVSPADHLRSSYRNFFQPHQRWQFSGIRLARDL